MNNTLNYEDYYNIEIEYLEHEKQKLIKEINKINERIHNIYNNYYNLDNINNIQISIKELINSLKYITNKDINIKINVLSSFYKDNTYKDLEESENIMNYIGSDLFITIDNKDTIYYSHLLLFNSFNDIQLDNKTLLEHSTSYKRTPSICDLVIDKDIDNIICNFNLNNISINTPAKNNDYLHILEQAIIHCIINDKVINNNVKTK